MPSHTARRVPAQAGLPLFWLFVNASCCAERNDGVRALVASVAPRWRGRAHFVWLDGGRCANPLTPALTLTHFVWLDGGRCAHP